MLHVTDPKTNHLLRLLAKKNGRTLAETFQQVIANEIDREIQRRSTSRPLRILQAEFRASLNRRRKIKRFEPWSVIKS